MPKKIASPVGRKVKEWRGKTPDAKVPDGVKLRILRRQKGLCAILKIAFGKHAKRLDHRIPLSQGGEHREKNLQWIIDDLHKIKTAHEAKERGKADRAAIKEARIGEPKAPIAQRPKPEKKPSKPSVVNRSPLFRAFMRQQEKSS